MYSEAFPDKRPLRLHTDSVSPHPVSPQETDLESASELTTSDTEAKRLNLLQKCAVFSGKTALGLVLTAHAFVSVAGVAYLIDVQQNKTIAAESLPTIDNIFPRTEKGIFPNTGTYVMAGFDAINGDAAALSLGKSIQETLGGSVMSINYGNAPLDAKEIARQIISDATSKNLISINLFGYSMGGVIAAEVADEIISNSGIHVNSVIMDQTPNGTQDLRPSTKTNLYSMLNALKFGDSKYSTAARVAGTMILESPRFMKDDGSIDYFKLFDTFNYANEQVKEQRRPGMWLLVDQALAINDDAIKDAFKHMSEQRGDKQMPVVLYLRPENPGDDQVILVVKAAESVCDDASTVTLTCDVLMVNGYAPHTNYLFNEHDTTAALAEDTPNIKTLIESEYSEIAPLPNDAIPLSGRKSIPISLQ